MLFPKDFIFIVAFLAVLTPLALTSPISNGTTNSTSLSTSSTSKISSRSSSTLPTFSSVANSSLSRASSSIGTPRQTSTSRPISSTSSISSSSSAPITPTPNPRVTPTSTINTSSGTQTITVSGGATITVVPGVVIFGGPGGGTIIVNGVAASIAPGALEVAGQNGDNPKTTPTEDITSSQPRSTQSSTSSSQSSSRSSSSSSSSASSSSTASPYLIIPVSGTTASEATSFTTTLEDTIGAVDVILISTDPGLISWSANLTPSQVSTVSANSIVQAVVADQPVIDSDPNPPNTRRSYREDNPYTEAPVSSLLWERDGTIQYQTNATAETKVFSQPDNTPIDSVTEYAYDSQAGVGATIYVMDSGANTGNSEYADTPGTKRWLFTTADQTQNDPDGHGSCAMSKAAGVTYGTAKRPNIVMVKIRYPMGVSTILVGIAAIMRDVKANGLSGKAVLNMSFGDKDLSDSATINLYHQYLQSLINMDVVVVAASGNARRVNGGTTFSDDVDSYPALFSRTAVSFSALPIIVVGAVDNNGERATFSQGTSILTVSAPGVDITCMSGTGTGTQVLSGTSFAAPAVAGLAAYFLSLDQYTNVLQKPGQVAQNMKTLISEKARARTNNGLVVASNAVNDMDCSSGTNAKIKRQASACSVSTASTTLATSTFSTVTTPAATTSTTTAPTSTALPNTDFLCTAHTQSACPADTDGATRCLGLDGAICVSTCPSDSTCPSSCTAQGFSSGYCSNGQYSCICTNADPTQNRG